MISQNRIEVVIISTSVT